MELKLSEIQNRARLNPSTVKYVLQNPEIVAGMPEAGSQGVHRRFTVAQAERLAVVTRLVMVGVPLRDAATTIRFIEKRIANVEREFREENEHAGKFVESTPWKLLIIDGDYLRLVRGKLEDPYWDYYRISTGKRERIRREPLDRYELELTLLRKNLSSD